MLRAFDESASESAMGDKNRASEVKLAALIFQILAINPMGSKPTVD